MNNTILRTGITVGGFAVAFLLGYAISAGTGTEPGYFEAVETGSYGAPETEAKVEGLSDAQADYYKSLLDN